MWTHAVLAVPIVSPASHPERSNILFGTRVMPEKTRIMPLEAPTFVRQRRATQE